MFIFKKQLSRRTFLRGTAAMWRCHFSMRWLRRRRRAIDGRDPEDALRLLLRAARRHDGQVDAGDEGNGFRVHRDPQAARAVPRPSNIVSGLAHPYVAGAGGADVSAGANHTRAAAVFLTGACPSAVRARISACRSIRWRRSTSVRTRRCRRSSCRSRKPCSPAKRRSAAPIATRSRGSRRPTRCRCRTIRGWCSRSCSATAGPTRERRARRQESRSLLDSVMGQVASLQKRPAAGRPPPPDAVPRRRARGRAADSARRGQRARATCSCPKCRPACRARSRII